MTLDLLQWKALSNLTQHWTDKLVMFLPKYTAGFLKILNDVRSPQRKRVSVNFSCTLFCLLDFLTVEEGTNRLS